MTTTDLTEAATSLGALTGRLLDRSAEAGFDRIWLAATGTREQVASTSLTPAQLDDARALIDALDTLPADGSVTTADGVALLETFHRGFAATSPLPPHPTAVLEMAYRESAARHLQLV